MLDAEPQVHRLSVDDVFGMVEAGILAEGGGPPVDVTELLGPAA